MFYWIFIGITTERATHIRMIRRLCKVWHENANNDNSERQPSNKIRPAEFRVHF